MSQTRAWSVKGIDERARDAARQAARDRGITLGEYLNTLLMDDEPPAQPYQRDTYAPRSASQSLDQLARRIETAEARSTLAITGIDQSVLGLLARLERSEESNAALAEHVDSVLTDIHSTHNALQEKVHELDAVEEVQTRNKESLETLEQALGQLASHVNDENALAQDEASAIKARVENGLGEVSERLEGLEVKVDTGLTTTAMRVDEVAEQTGEQVRHIDESLSDRLSTLEQDLNGRLASIDSVNDRIDDVTGDVAGALESMELTLVRIQERLNRAETTTDTALKSLDATFENLDKRIEDVARKASPEAAEALRRQFESRFEGLAADVRASVAAARAELADEIERAAAAQPAAIENIEASVADVKERLAATEARQDEILSSGGGAEAMIGEFERLSQTVEARLAEMETRETDAIARVSEEISGVVDQLTERVADSEQRSAEAIEQVGEQVAIVANRLQTRQEEISRTLSESLEASSRRQEARLSDALANVSERLETMQEQASTSLSPVQRAIAALATRLESLEDLSVGAPPATASPLDESPLLQDPSIEESLTDIPPPPFASSVAEEEEEPTEDFKATESAFEADADTFRDANAYQYEDAADDAPFEAGFDTWADAEDDTPATANEAEAVDPFEELSGLVDPLFEDATKTDVATPEFVADLPDITEQTDGFVSDAPRFESPDPAADPLAALEDWDDATSETRDSDIFDTGSEDDVFADPFASESSDESAMFDDAPTSEPLASHADAFEEDEVAQDYLSRARRAAQAAAQTAPQPASRRNRRKPASVADATSPKGSSRVPIYAAASAVAVAAAGAGGYLYIRGKQAAPVMQAATPAVATASEAQISQTTDEVELFAETAAPATTETLNDSQLIEPIATVAPERIISEPVETVAIAAIQPALEPITSLPSLEQAAEAGNPIAQYTLGLQRYEAEDYAVAASLIRRAADQGQPAAQYRLAKLHEKGLGVPRDLVAAREWTQRAARNGNIKAMHDLAVFFAEGEGGSQSYAGAVEWFRKASEYGVVDSQYNLGVLYEQGLGISPNLNEALTWFEIAARQGDPGAPAKVQALRSRVSPETAVHALARAETWTAAAGYGEANGVFADNAWRTALPVQVRATQNALSRFGYGPGAADGAMGPSTDQALRAFQRDAEIAVTGRIDDATIRALNTRINASTAGGAL